MIAHSGVAGSCSFEQVKRECETGPTSRPKAQPPPRPWPERSAAATGGIREGRQTTGIWCRDPQAGRPASKNDI